MQLDGADTQTHMQTDGHGDSMTNSAQRGRVGEKDKVVELVSGGSVINGAYPV